MVRELMTLPYVAMLLYLSMSYPFLVAVVLRSSTYPALDIHHTPQAFPRSPATILDIRGLKDIHAHVLQLRDQLLHVLGHRPSCDGACKLVPQREVQGLGNWT